MSKRMFKTESGRKSTVQTTLCNDACMHFAFCNDLSHKRGICINEITANKDYLMVSDCMQTIFMI